jgi:hypothetical protein
MKTGKNYVDVVVGEIFFIQYSIAYYTNYENRVIALRLNNYTFKTYNFSGRENLQKLW